MKRICFLISVLAVLFTNCSNNPHLTLEEKSKALVDSIVLEANNNPNNGNMVARSMKYVETTYSDDSLCLMNYSVQLYGREHVFEFVFAFPISRFKPSSKIHFWAHPIDTIIEGDRLNGTPIYKVFNLETEEVRKTIRSMEDLQEFKF